MSSIICCSCFYFIGSILWKTCFWSFLFIVHIWMKLVFPTSARSRQFIEKAMLLTLSSSCETGFCICKCEFLALTSSQPTKISICVIHIVSLSFQNCFVNRLYPVQVLNWFRFCTKRDLGTFLLPDHALTVCCYKQGSGSFVLEVMTHT